MNNSRGLLCLERIVSNAATSKNCLSVPYSLTFTQALKILLSMAFSGRKFVLTRLKDYDVVWLYIITPDLLTFVTTSDDFLT